MTIKHLRVRMRALVSRLRGSLAAGPGRRPAAPSRPLVEMLETRELLASNLASALSLAGPPAAAVDRLFPAVLGRAADAAGLAAWQDYLARGGSSTELAVSLLTSAEYQATRADWLQGLYVDVLGRPADPAGLNYWGKVLEAGRAPTDVARAFLGCPEFQALVSSAPAPLGGPALTVQLTPGVAAPLAGAEGAALRAGLSWEATGVAGRYRAVGEPAALDQLKNNLAGVAGAALDEPEVPIHVTLTPNDPYVANGQLWGLTGTNGVRAPAAWDSLTGSSSVVVAISDTGIDLDHPDLYKNIWINQDEIPSQWQAGSGLSRTVRRGEVKDTDDDERITFWDLNDAANVGLVNDANGDGRISAADVYRTPAQGGWEDKTDADSNGRRDDLFGWNFVANTNRPYDDNNHGTHVAGTIGGMGNNGLGVAGINWKVQLMAVKFLNSDGSGGDSGASGSIDYATREGARVINCSWGGGYSSRNYSSISAANTAGVLVVAAAGNSSANTDLSAAYPAGYNLPNIVSVAATTSSGGLASFSNYGATTVDLGAPGAGIISTVVGGKYASFNGTSMASPHVAGVAALVLASAPSFTVSQLKDQLLKTTTPLASLAGRTVTGGLVNASRAVLTTPVVQVQDGLRTVVDGAGSVVLSTLAGIRTTRTITIQNAGYTNLTVEGLSIPAGFTLEAGLGAVTLPPGASTTFVLGLSGVAAGSVSGPVTFRTNDPNHRTFTFTATGSVGTTAIADDGQASFSAGSGWLYAQGANYTQYCQSDTHYVLGTAGAAAATWTFTVTPGVYRVYATWTPHVNRATDAVYTIRDGALALARTTVNQEAAPDDLQDGGSWWESLADGTLVVTGSRLSVQLTGAANQYLIADALRIERVGDLPATVPAATIIDDGASGFTADSDWRYAEGSKYTEYYGADTHFRPGAAGADPATWTFTVTPGTYRVSATWTGYANRATDATYTVSDGAVVLGTAVVNQQQTPTDLQEGGSGWADLGGRTYVVAGTTLTVQLSGVGNQYLIADAVRVQRLGDLPAAAPAVQIVDNTTPGFSAGAGWTLATGASYTQYYGSDTYYRSGAAGAAPATWTFTVTPGIYRVSATWTVHGNRATDATYTVSDGAVVLGTAVVNQQQTPTDLQEGGSGWADLGGSGQVYTVSGYTLTVQLSGVANKILIADAIRVEKVA